MVCFARCLVSCFFFNCRTICHLRHLVCLLTFLRFLRGYLVDTPGFWLCGCFLSTFCFLGLSPFTAGYFFIRLLAHGAVIYLSRFCLRIIWLFCLSISAHIALECVLVSIYLVSFRGRRVGSVRFVFYMGRCCVTVHFILYCICFHSN